MQILQVTQHLDDKYYIEIRYPGLWTFSHLKTKFNGVKIKASPSATSGQSWMVKNGILLFWMVLAVVVFVREYDEWHKMRVARSKWLVSNYPLEK